jgi:hypothetical protein
MLDRFQSDLMEVTERPKRVIRIKAKEPTIHGPEVHMHKVSRARRAERHTEQLYLALTDRELW